MGLQEEIDAQAIRRVVDQLRDLAHVVQGVWRNTEDPALQSSLNGIWNRLDAARDLANQALSLLHRHNEMEK